MSVSIYQNRITTSFVEVAEGETPQESFGDRIEATRILRCAWGNRWQFAQELMPSVVPGSNLYNITLTLPHRYPYRTDLGLFCDSVMISPWVGNPAAGSPGPNLDNGPKLAWEWAYLHAHYQTLQGDTANAILWQEQMRPCAEFITLPYNELYWDDAQDDPIDPSSAPAFILRKIEWTVTRRFAPLNFPPQVLSYQGKINSTQVRSGIYPGLIFAPFTLLYNGVEVEQDRFSNGLPAVKLIMHFTGMNQDWDTFPHHRNLTSEVMSFDPMYKSNGDAFFPFDDVDFENLFGW
jgi:hypothetical protein